MYNTIQKCTIQYKNVQYNTSKNVHHNTSKNEKYNTRKGFLQSVFRNEEKTYK